MEANNETAVKSGKKDLSALDTLQVPVFVLNMDGKIVHGNDAFADLVGKKREQLEGIPFASLIKSDESSTERALDGDSTYVETWATIKNKKYFLEYRPNPIYDSKGNITGAIEAISRPDQPEAVSAGGPRTDRQGQGRRSVRQGQGRGRRGLQDSRGRPQRDAG